MLLFYWGKCPKRKTRERRNTEGRKKVQKEFQHEECTTLNIIYPGLNFVVQNTLWQFGEKEGWSYQEGCKRENGS